MGSRGDHVCMGALCVALSRLRYCINGTLNSSGCTNLQDIKACFPSDRNPFYAGFGNRDTDEFSYLKVGIPKGKIFIINPKVIMNRLE